MKINPRVIETDSIGQGIGAALPSIAAVETDGPQPAGEFHNFISDIEKLITSMTPLTGEDLARAKAKLNKRVAAARESITVMGSEVASRARKTARVTNRYVEENPWQAVGIGAALGLLIGVVVARRK